MKKLVLLILVLFVTASAQLGRVETVGYTTYDRQYGGPTVTWCRVNPVANNILVYWMYSNFNPTSDRNMRYNVYDFSISNWYWPEGINVFILLSSFGNIDYNPVNGLATAIAHQRINNVLTPIIARESQTGVFEYTQGPSGYQWPLIAIGQNQTAHCLMMKTTSPDSLWYFRTGATPINISVTIPPGYPNYNICASKISNKVIVLWQANNDISQRRAFYRLSDDGGINWQPVTQIPFPPAQGIVPSYHISSLFGMFDHQDNLHIVASVSDIGRTIPAQIWHYCPTNAVPWSLVYHYNAETLAAPVGYNALFASRPSLVQNPTNNYLYAVWEQFDSLNYESITNVARADIYVAESPDNGLTWQNHTRLTKPNSTSKRFPCAGGVINDTLIIAYLIDSLAGFEVYTQGRATRNPIVVQRLKVPLMSGINENSIAQMSSSTLKVKPNPFSSSAVIRYTIANENNAMLEIYDISGRVVKTWKINNSLDKEIIWSGKNNNNQTVPYGVYFIKLQTENKHIVEKVIYSR